MSCFIKNFKDWNFWEKLFRVVEIFLMFIMVFGILGLKYQMKSFNEEKNNNSFSTLFALEDRMLKSPNNEIISAINLGKPILKENSGSFSNDQLDQYLNDLVSIQDAYYKGRIDIESFYSWFEYIFTKTMDNKEIQNYISFSRKENKNNFIGLEETTKELREYEKQLK